MKASISYGGIFGASSEANRSNIQATFCGRYSEDLISMTTLDLTATGGPHEVSNLPDWKSGMAASNSTWSPIDRGRNLVPVWGIIQVRFWVECYMLFWPVHSKLDNQIVFSGAMAFMLALIPYY